MSTHNNASGNDADLLKEIREFTEIAIKGDNHNRLEAVADLKFLGGDQWPQGIKRERELSKRPCLTFNRLPTYLHQVTNDQRQDQVGIQVHPVGNGADKKGAEIYQGMIRRIEDSSNADVAYDTAVNSAAAIGFGFWRLITEYESPTSFNQVIKFKRERDSLKVYFDPSSVEADGSDAKRCVIVGDMAKDEFKRRYPGKLDACTNAMTAMGNQVQPGWMTDSMVRVVEYYYFDYKAATLYLLGDGTTTTKEPPTGVQVVNKRPTQLPQLKWVKACSGAVLEQTDIMCKWIPVFPVWGDEIDIQGKVLRKGIIRDAKDPAQMYNFWMTQATEEVGSRSKSPWVMAEGQDEGHEKQWANANTKNYSTLKYKPVTVDGLLAPPPQRQPMADVPVGMLQMAMHAADNIKAVTGLFDSSLGARGNATSGIQEREQQRQGDVANFHFIDNLRRSIRHCGRCLVDMIPHYYDAARVVEIMRENGKVESVAINQPATNEAGQPVDKDGQPILNPLQQVQHILNDVTIGQYGVTFDAGPSFATQREETKAAIVELGGKWPKLLDVAGDIAIENMDWQGADKIARRLKASMPAQITAGDEGEDGQAAGPASLPPEIEQHIQQADQLIDQLQQQLAEAKAGHQAMLDKAQLDAASREEVARINSQGKADVEEIKGMVAMLLQHMTPPAQLAAAATQTEDSRPAASQAAEPAQTLAQPE